LSSSPGLTDLAAVVTDLFDRVSAVELLLIFGALLILLLLLLVAFGLPFSGPPSIGFCDPDSVAVLLLS